MLLGLTLVSAVQVLVVVGILQYALPQSIAGALLFMARHFVADSFHFIVVVIYTTARHYLLLSNAQERCTIPNMGARL
jgi:hypothetical protein